MMRQKEREQLQQKQLHEEQEREQQQQQDPALLDQAVMEGCGAPPGLQRLLKRVATVNAARWAKGQGCVAVNLQDQLSPEEMEQLSECVGEGGGGHREGGEDMRRCLPACLPACHACMHVGRHVGKQPFCMCSLLCLPSLHGPIWSAASVHHVIVA
jgi:hypothetical protein